MKEALAPRLHDAFTTQLRRRRFAARSCTHLRGRAPTAGSAPGARLRRVATHEPLGAPRRPSALQFAAFFWRGACRSQALRRRALQRLERPVGRRAHGSGVRAPGLAGAPLGGPSHDSYTVGAHRCARRRQAPLEMGERARACPCSRSLAREPTSCSPAGEPPLGPYTGAHGKALRHSAAAEHAAAVEEGGSTWRLLTCAPCSASACVRSPRHKVSARCRRGVGETSPFRDGVPGRPPMHGPKRGHGLLIQLASQRPAQRRTLGVLGASTGRCL